MLRGRPFGVINRRRYVELCLEGFVCRVDRLRWIVSASSRRWTSAKA
jgi:hypothetical protein